VFISNFDIERVFFQSLLEEKPDLVALETLPKLNEVQILVDLLATEFPDARVWMTASCKDELHIVSFDVGL
jgi:homocysteine S-methyltransferase